MMNTSGSFSTCAFVAFVVLSLAIGSPPARAAEKRKLRWIESIYLDAAGNSLKHPEGVACDDDYIVVADTGNRRLLRYSYGDDTATSEAEYLLPKSYPIKVEIDSKGDIYFLDGRERRIVVIGAAGEERGAVEPKSLPSSREVVPKSFAIGADDDIYVLDIFSGRVLVLDAEGQYRRHVDFPEEYGFFTDVEVDPKGSIYLLDGADVVVYKALSGAKQFTRLTDDVDAYVNFATNLSLDGRGFLYLVDQYGSGIALVSGDGTFKGRLLEMGWDEKRLFYPSQICISPSGDLFIADRNNSRVQRFRVNDGSSAEHRDDADPSE